MNKGGVTGKEEDGRVSWAASSSSTWSLLLDDVLVGNAGAAVLVLHLMRVILLGTRCPRASRAAAQAVALPTLALPVSPPTAVTSRPSPLLAPPFSFLINSNFVPGLQVRLIEPGPRLVRRNHRV